MEKKYIDGSSPFEKLRLRGVDKTALPTGEAARSVLALVALASRAFFVHVGKNA